MLYRWRKNQVLAGETQCEACGILASWACALQAYNVLHDPDQRKCYDRLQLDVRSTFRGSDIGNGTGVVTFLVPRHGSRATDAVPMGVGIHTHVSTQYILFLSYWCISLVALARKFPHTLWLYMFHSASNSKTHWHSLVLLHASALHSALLHQSKKNKTHWQTEHVVFFGIQHFVFTNCVLPSKQNLLAPPSFSKFLSIMSCIAPPKQQQENAPAHWLFPCNIFSVHIPSCTAHTGTDWAKRIGTVLFCFITQRYIMQCLCAPFFRHLILLLRARRIGTV